MFGTSVRAACCYSPDSCCVHETLGRSVNCTVSTVGASVLDGFPATATDVLRFRLLYLGYVAAPCFALDPLSRRYAGTHLDRVCSTRAKIFPPFRGRQ